MIGHREVAAARTLVFILIILCVSSAPARAADKNCGAYCLYVALRGLEFDIPAYKEFEKTLDPAPGDGYSMAQLGEVAKRHGAHFLGVQTSLENLALRRERLACLALLREGHYVLISDFAGGDVTILDPPRVKTIPASTLGIGWSGDALLISKVPLALEEELVTGRGVVVNTLIVLGLMVVLCVGLISRRRAKRLSIGACLAAAMLSSTGCSESPSPDAGSRKPPVTALPILSIAQSDLDLGRLPSRSTRHVESIILKNRGTVDLRLERITTTCGCAAISQVERSIAPGGSTTLSVGLDCSVAGSRAAQVLIHSSDPVNPIWRIRLHWEPIGQFVFKPASLEFGIVLPNSVAYSVVELIPARNVNAEPLQKIKEVVCTPAENLSCEVESSINSHTIRIRLVTTSLSQDIHGIIRVRLEGADLPDCNLPVHFQVRPPIDIKPESLYVGSGKTGGTSEGAVVVTSTDGTLLEVSDVRFDREVPGSQVRVSSVGVSRVLVNVSYEHGQTLGVTKEFLTIKIKRPIEQTIRVPVMAMTRID